MRWFNFGKDESAEKASFIPDPELEFEADKSGMVHVRKNTGKSRVLPGYGTTEFGVSSFEEEKSLTTGRILLGTGLAIAGIWLKKNARTLADYALLLRESSKS